MIDDRAVEAAPLAELAADVKRRAIELIDGMPDREAAALADLMERIADLTDAAKADASWQVPDGCLNVGHQVVKTKGYPFPGEVRAVFKTRAGFVRYVVEATGEDYRGMLHIFDATQLALLRAKPNGGDNG